METVPITEFIVDNPKKNDWVGILIIAVMLIGAVMVCYYLISHDIASCTKDPIKYAFKDSNMTEKYAYAELRIFQNEDDLIPIFSKKISSGS